MEITSVSGHGLLWFGLRVIAIFFGFLITFLGYRLLCLGILQPGEGTDIEAIWGDRKMLVKRATPGVLFALAGMGVIFTSVLTAPEGTVHRSRRISREAVPIPAVLAPGDGIVEGLLRDDRMDFVEVPIIEEYEEEFYDEYYEEMDEMDEPP